MPSSSTPVPNSTAKTSPTPSVSTPTYSSIATGARAKIDQSKPIIPGLPNDEFSKALKSGDKKKEKKKKNAERKKAKDMVPNDFKVTPDVAEKITDQTADFTFDDDDADHDAFEDSKETPDEDKQDFRSALDFGTPLNFKSSFGQNVARSVS